MRPRGRRTVLQLRSRRDQGPQVRSIAVQRHSGTHDFQILHKSLQVDDAGVDVSQDRRMQAEKPEWSLSKLGVSSFTSQALFCKLFWKDLLNRTLHLYPTPPSTVKFQWGPAIKTQACKVKFGPCEMRVCWHSSQRPRALLCSNAEPL